MKTTPPEAGRVRRYGIALLAASVAFAASYATWPLSSSMAWVFFFAAIMSSSWFGGAGPSLATAAVLVVLGRFFFMKPYGSLSLTIDHIVQILVFAGVSLFIAFLTSVGRRAEAFERGERRRFQATVTSIGDAVIAADAAGRVTFMNGVAEGLTGWGASEAAGRRLEEVFVIVNEATREPTPNPVAKVLVTGKIQGLANHTILIARDGAERPIDDSAAPINDDRGRITGVVLVFHDVAEKRRAEKALARSEARLRELFHSMVEGFCVIEVIFDPDGRAADYRFLEVNSAFEHHTGLKDAAGKRMRELAPEHDAHWFEIYGKVAVTGEAVRFINEAKALDGRWFDVSAYRIGEPEERKVAILFMDITERVRAQAEREQLVAASESQRRIYEAALSNTPDLVYVFGLDHRFAYANEALLRLWDKTPEEALGKTCLELGYEPWHAAMHDREIDQVVATRRPIRGEVPFSGTNGRRVYDYIFVPVIGGGGEVVAVAGTTRDVTERHSAEEAIREQAERLRDHDRHKDEFLAMLAHELRNPLAAIGNAVQLTSRSNLHEHVEWSMDVITRQMRHLTRLIDDLLDVSRISRGKIELRRDVIDIAPILEGAAATARAIVEERKHTLDLDIDRGRLWADVDATRLEQVVANLLNNAAKYSEDGSHITLTARREGGDVVVTVRDRGIGIPAEKLPQMFELFAQGDRSLARSEGGLGIGLTVVKKLVELHGGTVTAASEGPGKGSEFTIRLPAAARPDASEATPVEPTKPEGRASRVLIVEDNVDTARGMARLLTLIGHEVATAHDGFAALDVARRFAPECILLDIGLPGMDGYEVASRLRREECCKDALIVAISGYSQDEDRRRSKAAGFDHHLIKPLDHDALLALLSAGASGRG